MTISTKIIARAHAPYKKEAIYCFLTNSIIAISCIVILGLFFHDSSTFFLCTSFLMCLWWILAEYISFRLILFAFLETKKSKWITQPITIEKICEDRILSGRKLTSIIPKLYDPQMRVNAYKFVCKDSTGKRIVVRCVMSGKKAQLLLDKMYNEKKVTCCITFGEYSHIIILFQDKEDWADKMNHMF